MEEEKHGEHTLEEVFEAPARFLEREVEAVKREEQRIKGKAPLHAAEEYWETLGPGLTSGASDNDPSGIATYSQAGAQYGLQLSWLLIFTFPLMSMIQEMCARIGLVSGRGLAANIRHYYKARALHLVTSLLFLANVLNITADLSAMAASARLLFPHVSFILFIIGFAVFSLVLQIFTTYARYAKYLKYLALTLISYIVVAVLVHPHWLNIMYHAFIPTITFSKGELLLVCAVLGTTISPYLFFWQTSQEVEESILRGETTVEMRKASVTNQKVRRMRTDVWSGMLFSNLSGFFIFVACASTIFLAHGSSVIQTAADAALALKPFGTLAMPIFALGIISTGLLAIPVLAGSSAYAFSESFGWRSGLYRKLKQAYAFYGVIIVSIVVGIVANFFHIDPIKALIYSAIANGIIAPIILFFIIRLSGNKHLMGEHRNKKIISFFGWLTFVLMTVAGIAAILSF